MLLARQRGDDNARVGLALGPFGLGDDAAFVAPTVARSPGKVLEATRRLAGFPALLGGLGEFALDLLDQAAVLGQAELFLRLRLRQHLQRGSSVVADRATLTASDLPAGR